MNLGLVVNDALHPDFGFIPSDGIFEGSKTLRSVQVKEPFKRQFFIYLLIRGTQPDN